MNARASFRALSSMALTSHVAECSRLLDEHPAANIAEFLEHQRPSAAADALTHLIPDTAADVISELTEDTARAVLPRMGPHRVAPLVARLDPEVRENRLALLPPEFAEEIRDLIAYPRDCAGASMDPGVTSFPYHATARDVLRKLRQLRRRQIHDVFLVDPDGRLRGMVSLQTIVLADPTASLCDLASTAVPSIRATDSRDQVSEVLETHGVSSLPVVDLDGRLLGVLRHEQIVAAAEQAASVDMQTMFGASKDERALSSPLFAVRRRLPWLQVNLLTAFVAAAVVGIFEHTISEVTALAILLPVVAGQSGNTGAQALAVTMRGLALREIRIRHWLRVAVKEVATGALNGVAVALTTGLAVYVWSQSPALAAVVAVSMVISMIAAALAGALIPMVLTAVRLDPAQSSSIVLTTITDVVGFSSFLGIATLFLSHLPGS